MKFLSGFESTHIFGSGIDVLETSGHAARLAEDFALVRRCGLRELRYPAPWHRIEKVRGTYDWRWMDKALMHLRLSNIDPIIDPLHHTSFPDWLEGGFANPDFPQLYLDFVTAFAFRYPWVSHYTVVNEPFVTTWFCGHEGKWYPFGSGDRVFVPMLMNVIEATVSVSRMLVENLPRVTLVHVDAAESHRALDIESEPHAYRGNQLRFIVPDLILGRVGTGHPLYDYLLENGASEERLAEFRAKPARIDIMGLDYYSHCELEWCVDGRHLPNRYAQGLVPTALEYAQRYRLPLMLTETNIRGYVSDRISWLKFMVEQCEELERRLIRMGLTFEGFCWYPFIDSTDWCSLVTQANRRIDPQGIYWLEPRTLRRNESELTDIYRGLATGQITSKDIPAYRFMPPMDEALSGLMPKMSHWNWRTPGGIQSAAKPDVDRYATSAPARAKRRAVAAAGR